MKNKLRYMFLIVLISVGFANVSYAYLIFVEWEANDGRGGHSTALAIMNGSSKSAAMAKYKKDTKHVDARIVGKCESGWAAIFSAFATGAGGAYGWACGYSDEKSAIERAKKELFRKSVDWNRHKQMQAGYVWGDVWYDDGSGIAVGTYIRGADGRYRSGTEHIAVDRSGNIMTMTETEGNRASDYQRTYTPKVFKKNKITKKKSGNNQVRSRPNVGVFIDKTTGLMWAKTDNGENIDWYSAKEYCKNYSGGGYTNWRMPNVRELEGLYRSGTPQSVKNSRVKVRINPAIKLTEFTIWTSSKETWDEIVQLVGEDDAEEFADLVKDQAYLFHFTDGKKYSVKKSRSSLIRVLPVRDFR